MRNGRSVWRNRAGLLGALGSVNLALLGILVYYSFFLDSRIVALSERKTELEKSRDDARAAVEKVKASERRFVELRSQVESFYTETLGPRKERLAPIIEDVYTIGRKLGLRPDSIAYTEDETVGGDRLGLSFKVKGTYTDVKKMIASMEANPRLLILSEVGVSVDDEDPDRLDVTLSLAHFFRSEISHVAKKMARSSKVSKEKTKSTSSRRSGR